MTQSNENQYDDGFNGDWTLYDAFKAIQREAWVRACEQLPFEAEQTLERQQELCDWYMAQMLDQAEKLLNAEYKTVDFENVCFQMQYFAIDGPEDPSQAWDEAQNPNRQETADNIPSPEDLEDWLEG